MSTRLVVFLSAVSDEFHTPAPLDPSAFKSYRGVLAHYFRKLGPGYEVIVQEDLAEGLGDLLETLDLEVSKSTLVIHLVGEMAGAVPKPACIRRLRERHPDFLAHEPELLALLGDFSGISHTQWEAYFAFHHRRPRLIFRSADDAPRSPIAIHDPAELSSQQAHFRRLDEIGEHYGSFHDQYHLAAEAITSAVRFGLGPAAPPPAPEAIAAARADAAGLVAEIAEKIKKPDRHTSLINDPAGIERVLAAVDTAALRRELDRRTALDIAHRHREGIRASNAVDPTPETLLDEAFAEFALGAYAAARLVARRAADLALELRVRKPEDSGASREIAQNALLLIHEAAKATHNISAAIAALEEAGALVDKNADPILWADVHEFLAGFLLEHAIWDRADDLVSDIIDIREEHQGENNSALANTLLVWVRLLYSRADYPGVESVARRAERILWAHTPPLLPRIVRALNWRAKALYEENRLVEAEPLMRRALAIAEECFGPDHPEVAADLNDLAALLKDTNRLAEAEPLIRRALAIDEERLGPDHPEVATNLNNLARLLEVTDRLAEAEPLTRRALAIDEECFGSNHPKVATNLNHLAQLLQETNRLAEAEPLYRRALAIDEQCFGPDHPDVSADLNNLAALLNATNRLAEAEPLIRRALAIVEVCFGPNHPKVAACLKNLAELLQGTDRLAEAELLLRRALTIDEQCLGPDHPHIATNLNNLAILLNATNRLAEAEPLMRRALAIDEQCFGPNHPKVATHLTNLAALLTDTNCLAEAEALMRRALAIVEQRFGPDHPQVATSFSNLAALLWTANRLAEAEPLMRRATEVLLRFTQTTNQQHPDLQEAVLNYAGLLSELGRTPEEVQAQINELCCPLGIRLSETI